MLYVLDTPFLAFTQGPVSQSRTSRRSNSNKQAFFFPLYSSKADDSNEPRKVFFNAGYTYIDRSVQVFTVCFHRVRSRRVRLHEALPAAPLPPTLLLRDQAGDHMLLRTLIHHSGTKVAEL